MDLVLSYLVYRASKISEYYTENSLVKMYHYNNNNGKEFCLECFTNVCKGPVVF